MSEAPSFNECRGRLAQFFNEVIDHLIRPAFIGVLAISLLQDGDIKIGFLPLAIVSFAVINYSQRDVHSDKFIDTLAKIIEFYGLIFISSYYGFIDFDIITSLVGWPIEVFFIALILIPTGVRVWQCCKQALNGTEVWLMWAGSGFILAFLASMLANCPHEERFFIAMVAVYLILTLIKVARGK